MDEWIVAEPGRGQQMSLDAQWAIIAVVIVAILGAVLYNGAWHRGYAEGVRATTAAIFDRPKPTAAP